MNDNRVNGKGKSMKDLEGKEIEFPVTYKLKAVMIGADDNANMRKLGDVFTSLNIEHDYLVKKVSSKGSYVSYSYQVTINNREQMNALYADLKKIKGLKFAV